jgi:hypothetical protein
MVQIGFVQAVRTAVSSMFALALEKYVSYLVAYVGLLRIGLTDLVLWVDILSRMFSGSVSALCPLLCLKKSMTVLRREALVEAFALSWSSVCSGGTFSLASCADCLLRFIRGRPKCNALRPASSSSVVLKRPKRILQEIQAEPRRHQKRDRGGQERKRQTGKGYKPKKQDNPSRGQQTRGLGQDQQDSHISPEPACIK